MELTFKDGVQACIPTLLGYIIIVISSVVVCKEYNL